MIRHETATSGPDRNSCQALEVALVGSDMAVLVVGPCTDELTRVLESEGCAVSRAEVSDLPVGERFDRIVMSDVIGHVDDPVGVLRRVRNLLATDGTIVVSVPNAAHGAVRLAWLAGSPNTEGDGGRASPYTLPRLVAVLAEAQLDVREAWATSCDVVASESDYATQGWPDDLVEWLRHQPGALDLEYVIAVSPGVGDRVLPPVRPTLEPSAVRPDDGFARAAHGLQQQRLDELIQRDQLIGVTISPSPTQRELRDAEDRAVAAESDLALLRRELTAMTEDRERMRASATWRIGSAVIAPRRVLKKLLR